MSQKIPPSPRQVLLGLFIVGQIAFLIASNTLGFVQWFPTLKREKPNELINRIAPNFAEKQGHGWQWTEQAEANLRRWTELTGQEQGWSLFAPTISKETGFPAVLLSWHDAQPETKGFAGALFSFDQKNGFNLCAAWNHPPAPHSLSLTSHLGLLTAQSPWEALTLHALCRVRASETLPPTELLLSENEPPDLQRYLRVSKCRVRKFEGNFYFNPQPYDYENPEMLGSRLNNRVREFVNDYHDLALAYLKWRLKTWQAAHPDAPAPKQVILIQRFYRIHDPKEPRGLDGPYVVPMARWLPTRMPEAGFQVLEPFDFTEQRFKQ